MDLASLITHRTPMSAFSPIGAERPLQVIYVPFQIALAPPACSQPSPFVSLPQLQQQFGGPLAPIYMSKGVLDAPETKVKSVEKLWGTGKGRGIPWRPGCT